MALRDYQSRAVRDVYRELRKHQTTVLQLPTGAGKTHVAMAIINHGLEHGRRITFIADRLTLIDQTVDRFIEDQIHVGVIQSGHPMFNPAARVQVCSVATLDRRNYWPESDLVIVDECHDQYQFIYDKLAESGTKAIGLSATPFTTGMGRHWDSLVVGVTTRELMDMGYLCGYEAFGPDTPDMKGVKTNAKGEYSSKQVEERVTEIAGNVAKNYDENGEGRLALGFAVTVAHAKILAERFVARGIPADYVEGRDDSERRQRVLGQFKSGDIQVLFNVGVMTKGVDIPQIRCLIDAQPTRSLARHIQKMGRGLRTHTTKGNCLIFDHAGNLERNGFPDDDLPRELCMKEKGVSSVDVRDKKTPEPWNCPKCTHVNKAGDLQCVCCGFRRQPPARVNETEERLVRLTGNAPDKQNIYSQLMTVCADRGYKQGWAANKYRELTGAWPRGLTPTRVEPTPEMLNWIKSQQIRYAKRRDQ